MERTLGAGVSVTDISPPAGNRTGRIPASPAPQPRGARSLYAACLFLDDGATRLAIVTMDLLMFSKTYVRQVREEAARRCRIPARNILICCSHTHSSPWTATGPHMEALMDGQQPNPEYLAALQSQTGRADRRRPARTPSRPDWGSARGTAAESAAWRQPPRTPGGGRPGGVDRGRPGHAGATGGPAWSSTRCTRLSCTRTTFWSAPTTPAI